MRSDTSVREVEPYPFVGGAIQRRRSDAENPPRGPFRSGTAFAMSLANGEMTMLTSKMISLAATSALLLAVGSANADEAAPEPEKATAQATRPDADRPSPNAAHSRVFGSGSVAGIMNPAGIQLDATVQYRGVLSTDERTGAEKSYLQAGGGFRLNPVYVGHSVHGEWSPAQFLTLRTEYELMGFPGTTRGLLSFSEKTAAFGDDQLTGGDAHSGVMHKAMLAPTFQSKFGPVILRNKSHVAYYHATTVGPYFYEPGHDTLIAKDDVVIQGRTELLLLAWRGGREAGLVFGPVYEVTRAIRTEVSRQRLGGMMAMTVADRIGGFYRPGFFVEVGGNLEDRNRENQAYATFGIKMDMQ